MQSGSACYKRGKRPAYYGDTHLQRGWQDSFGTPPETAVVVLQSLGVDAIGVNCSTGPAEMIALVEKMAEYSTVPLIAKPNAGLPELEDGKTVYKMTPDMLPMR